MSLLENPLFANSENNSKRLDDLEDSDEDSWSTVAYVHEKVKFLR